MQATARVPGSCGELVQGTLSGVNFHVTCPVNMYSQVTVKITEDKKVTIGSGADKVKAAVRLALDFLGMPEGGAKVSIESAIPQGKGMASSTADISAAIAAVALAVGKFIDPRKIAEFALTIEPSDGIMFSGVVLFDHIKGSLLEYIGPAPALELLIIDLGGQVDTREFNKRADLRTLNIENEQDIKRALELLKKGFHLKNNAYLGQAASLSALANQKILGKEPLPKIQKMAIQWGALGINVAHSGTVVGLIFEPGKIKPGLETLIRETINLNCQINKVHMVNGGIEFLTVERGQQVWKNYTTYMGETYGQPQENMV